MDAVKVSQVYVSSVVFECSHYKAPRGYGMWAFSSYADERANRREGIYWHSGSYRDAKAAAKAHFAALGVVDVVVLP